MARCFHPKFWPYGVWFTIGFLTVVVAGGYWAMTSPRSILLTGARGAQWIRLDRTFDLAAAPPDSFAVFASNYVVRDEPASAVLRITALRRFVVLIDGKKIFDAGANISNWRQEYPIVIPASALTQGTHKLKLMVANKFGPSLVRADCEALGIRTGSGWEASGDQHTWSPAVAADEPWEPPIAREFPTSAASMAHLLPFIVIILAIGGAGYVAFTNFTAGQNHSSARWIRWVVLVLWAVLALHNYSRLPEGIGYDVTMHLEYVHYVADHWRCPLPTDGIEMYHPPLYYLLSAVLYKLAIACGATVGQADTWLRVIPLGCGLAMVEISYRAARIVYPSSQLHQGVATVVGGLLPMNLYMGQAVSNEPLAAVLCGIVMLQCLRLLAQTEVEISHRKWLFQAFAIGLLLGLAVMTKVTGLIWVAIAVCVFGFVALNGRLFTGSSHARFLRAATGWTAVLSGATLISGWYFYRNWRAIGFPFLTHAALGGTRWWQHPGYRTPAQLFTFGRSLVTPVYGNLTGLWDNLYSTLWSDGMLNGVAIYQARPPWNYELMACGLWLSLLPMAAILVGSVPVLMRRNQPDAIVKLGLRFAVICVVVFVFAMLYLWLTWPIYSTVKASYLLSLTPCFALLAAAGFGRVTPNRFFGR